MKIRNGCVSNSSSSSFCILGVMVDDVDNYDLSNSILEEECGISTYYEKYFIGMFIETIPEDKTIAEMKGFIKYELGKIGIEDADVSWYVDGGYDG